MQMWDESCEDGRQNSAGRGLARERSAGRRAGASVGKSVKGRAGGTFPEPCSRPQHPWGEGAQQPTEGLLHPGPELHTVTWLNRVRERGLHLQTRPVTVLDRPVLCGFRALITPLGLSVFVPDCK